MASRRLQKRIEAEAAEKLGKPSTKKAAKKRATRKKAKSTRKRKTKVAERKKMYWGVFTGTLKEEGRYPYDQREQAEEKLAALRARSTKKLYFIQPIKESLSAASAALREADDDLEIDEELENTPDVEAEDDLDASDDDLDAGDDDDESSLDDDEFDDDDD